MAASGEHRLDHPVGSHPIEIPALMRRYGLHADKRLGQNFLVDIDSLHKVVEAASLDPQDRVLEIGAGLGNLTRLLATQVSYVVAVELDTRLLPPLQEVLAPFTNIKIIAGDILALDPGEFFKDEDSDTGHYLVVANIPYYITSAVMRHLLEARPQPDRMVLTIQHEVAERICAAPGDLSLLALSVQVYGKPRIMARLPAGAFYPPPKVDSAVIRVDMYAKSVIPPAQIELFFRLAKAGFSQKRKTIRNAIAGSLAYSTQSVEALLRSAGIEPSRRAETLDLEEWSRLTEEYMIMNKEASAKRL